MLSNSSVWDYTDCLIIVCCPELKLSEIWKRHQCKLETISIFFIMNYSMWLLLLSHFSRVQLCVTPIDGSPPGSPVPGILQARTLEWVAISFSNAWKWKMKVKSLSRVRLFATPWTAAYRLLRPWDFPGKSTGVGWHCLNPVYVAAFGSIHLSA